MYIMCIYIYMYWKYGKENPFFWWLKCLEPQLVTGCRPENTKSRRGRGTK